MKYQLSILGVAAIALTAASTHLPAQAPAAAAQPPGVLRNGNFSPIIADLDKSLAFYEGLLKMQVPPARDGKRPFFNNPGLHKMFGTTGANERHTDARIPGTSMGIEMIEYHDIERRAVHPRFQDPGAVTLVLLVRDVDALLARLTKAGVPVLTPGGKPVAIEGARAVLVADPDARPVELRQLTVPPPTNAAAGSEIVGGRLAITVADMDVTAGVFRDVLGFQVGTPTAFAPDKAFAALSGVKGAQMRRGLAQAPGTAQIFEFLEFKGVERTPLTSRIQDPGSVRIQMMVRGIDEVMAGMSRAGARVVSDNGQKATLPPNFWGVMTAGPDNLFLSLLEPCTANCSSERITPVGASR
jgi:catechol 2,3-dioxygenase-like lactoylglutathione lyase family enzyme